VSREPIYPPVFFSNDLLAAIVPEALTFISRAPRALPGNWENGAYLGPALVTLIGSYTLRSWHQKEARLLLMVLAVVFIASLGPKLYVADHPTIALPWSLVTTYLPVLNIALPARFMLFGWLIIGMIAAIWCKRTNGVPARSKLALAMLSIIFLMPDPLWLRRAISKVDTPQFFSGGLYGHYIRPGENILIIPYARGGGSMLWQAEVRMGFRMAGGYTGTAPEEFLRWPIVNGFYTSTLPSAAGDQLKVFLANYEIGAVVVTESKKWPWPEVLSTLGVKPLDIGGVALYQVPPQIITQYRNRSALQMESRADAAWFGELVSAANTYLSRGLDLRDLTPVKAAQLGLLPAAVWTDNLESLVIQRRIGGPMLWIGPWLDKSVAVAIIGSSGAIRPLIERYRSDVDTIYFPYPDKVGDNLRPDNTPEILLMVFGREGLARAAQQASRETTVQSTAAVGIETHALIR
jgi:hypothetical protein